MLWQNKIFWTLKNPTALPAETPTRHPIGQVYLVGGAVRDALMGRGGQDRDWVVVGSTPQALVDAGYRAVGADFPVFLHPHTREEYALARTERKTAPGYKGFAVHAAADVTLEQDLGRRDLTINAIALPQEHVHSDAVVDARYLVDPFGGVRDIHNKVLRHTTNAFREDPVRVLRLARFAARFHDFSVAPDTMELMQAMVHDGEMQHLVAERVWQELAKGLMEAQPARMFGVLRQCEALAIILPELDRLWGVPQSVQHHPEIDTGIHVMLVINMAAQLNASLPVRYAALVHDLGKGTTPADVLPRHIGHEERSVRLLRVVGKRLRVPTECNELAEVVAREHGNIHRSADLGAAATLRLLERCDAFRKPERFADILLACECDARGRLGLHDSPYLQRARLAQALAIAQAVPTQAIAEAAQTQGAQGPAIGAAIQAARIAALASDPAFTAGASDQPG